MAQASQVSTGKYRPEVDGLRAVAVVAVVLFHIGLIPGGFVGVDVFFVISGYLITRLLAEEMLSTGTIRLADFYRRRIRRLLPALTVMLLVVGALSLLVLAPFGELQTLSKTMVATALNVSNIFFMRRLGYFEPGSEENPLLHTWTLGVEEQFYLVWPLGLILLARAGGDVRRRMTLALAALTVLSFALGLWATVQAPLPAFFSMPTRAWEFGLGALLALVPVAAPRALSAVAGALMIAAAFVLLNAETPFPGVAAVLPALGAALLIHGSAGGTLVGRALGARPMVFIGLLSYSIYLWHWPLIVFGRLLAPEAGVVGDALAAIGSVGAAWLSWRFVETPLRRRKGAAIRAGLLASGLMVVLAGGVAAYAAALPKLSPRVAALDRQAGDIAPASIRCHSDTEWRLQPVERCTLGEGEPRLLLWGDSHADHLTPTFAQLGAPTLVRSFGACPPVVGGYPYRNSEPNVACGRFNDAVAAELVRLGGIRGVVLSGDWPQYEDVRWNGSPFETGLAQRVAALRERGLKVLIVAPSPSLRDRAPACLYRHSEADCSITRSEAEQRRASTMAVIQQLAAKDDGVRVWDPLPALCDADTCRPSRDSLLYFDRHHLTATTARSLAPSIAPLVAWAAG